MSLKTSEENKGMRIKTPLLALTITSLLSGCQNLDNNTLMQSGVQAFQAATLSDAQVKTLSEQSCAQTDKEAKLAPADSSYTKRLNNIADALGHDINGTPANYKVYLTTEVNAWAMANGCIRVYSGLMDIMTDNEVEGVLGHEMGHVALGHSRKAMQVAYATSAARTAVASAGGVATSLSQSQLADMGEQLVNAQFSQTQERQADNYSFDLLKRRGIDQQGLASSFEKLAKLDAGRKSSMFDSHPAAEERAQHIRDRIAAGK